MAQFGRRTRQVTGNHNKAPERREVGKEALDRYYSTSYPCDGGQGCWTLNTADCKYLDIPCFFFFLEAHRHLVTTACPATAGPLSGRGRMQDLAISPRSGSRPSRRVRTVCVCSSVLCALCGLCGLCDARVGQFMQMLSHPVLMSTRKDQLTWALANAIGPLRRADSAASQPAIFPQGIPRRAERAVQCDVNFGWMGRVGGGESRWRGLSIIRR